MEQSSTERSRQQRPVRIVTEFSHDFAKRISHPTTSFFPSTDHWKQRDPHSSNCTMSTSFENDSKEQSESDTPPNSSDFVIREGFPALRLADGSSWNIDKAEPLPRFPVWACPGALTFRNLDMWQLDCETVFSARTREDEQAYSAGVTYFMPCQMKPRCALEGLVLSIFEKHTKHLESDVIYSPEQSGAEWWTLVLDDDDDDKDAQGTRSNNENDEEDESDEVGMHFDADYGLEAQARNLLLHPRLASVTYLSDYGAPTVVLNRKSPPPDDTEHKALAGSVDTMWVSHPSTGKHLAFDGRLLHGAPATFFPAKVQQQQSPDEPPPSKKSRVSRKRYTVLVNIWLNHCPLDAEPLDDKVCEELLVKWDSEDPCFAWNEQLKLSEPTEPLETIELKSSATDPAGEEEVVICSRLVTIKYNAAMQALHDACNKDGTLIKLACLESAVEIELGRVVEDDDES